MVAAAPQVWALGIVPCPGDTDGAAESSRYRTPGRPASSRAATCPTNPIAPSRAIFMVSMVAEDGRPICVDTGKRDLVG